MKNSSAPDLESQYSTTTTDPMASDSSGAPGDTVSAPISTEPISNGGAATVSLRDPNFGGNLAPIYAITARLAGRLNATRITQAEHQGLLRERQKLLDKKFKGEIDRRESNRLEYVRWSLDRIEDAKHGDVLDELEAAVRRYETFGDSVLDLKQQLTGGVEAERQRQQKRSKTRR
jgi:hypothetical protein